MSTGRPWRREAPTPSALPFILALLTLPLCLGIVGAGWQQPWGWPLVALGLAGTLFTASYWMIDVLGAMQSRGSRRLLWAGALTIDAVSLATLLAQFLNARHRAPEWPPPGAESSPTAAFILAALVLLGGWSLAGIQRSGLRARQFAQVRLALLLQAACGVLAISIVAGASGWLIGSGAFSPRTSAAAAGWHAMLLWVALNVAAASSGSLLARANLSSGAAPDALQPGARLWFITAPVGAVVLVALQVLL